MATLTDALRADLQADLGISADQAVWTDDELDRLYTRAASDYTQTVILALRQLRVNAVRFTDYTAGATREAKSQIFDHLGEILAYYETEVADAGTQIRMVGTQRVPPRVRDKPRT